MTDGDFGLYLNDLSNLEEASYAQSVNDHGDGHFGCFPTGVCAGFSGEVCLPHAGSVSWYKYDDGHNVSRLWHHLGIFELVDVQRADVTGLYQFVRETGSGRFE